ncbi:MAG: hypothetical protein HQL14_04295 [Candidatus Omnitrophica bacterium]|nr:hypothetical protein [Candidatus Omnitrophota bacterium]
MKKILLLLLVLGLAGCATSVRYVSYTQQKFRPKPRDYFIVTYSNTQPPPATPTYTVIGRLEISGHASDGVSSNTLTDQSQAIARQKGADAIINAETQALNYSWVVVHPAHTTYHPVVVSETYYGHGHEVLETAYVPHYHPTRYIPYNDTIMTFKGDLVVFVAAQSSSSSVNQKK